MNKQGINWINNELKPKICNSVEFMYDERDSQSGKCLPLIYTPFDANNRLHWCDRGYIFDYLLSTEGEGKILLDFGPGDGWPSLLLAQYVNKIIGTEGSKHRVEVCIENANRLGISNVDFIYVKPGTSLPIEDDSIDGITAAHSVEQTPDPVSILQEFYRILKPNGRLRIDYEALSRYQNGREQEVFLDRIGTDRWRLTFYDRDIRDEYANMYSFIVTMESKELSTFIPIDVNRFSIDKITLPFLKKIKPLITNPRVCTLCHPSGKTLVSWLKEIGFREVIPTHGGGKIAGQLFDGFSDKNRPKKIDDVDAFIKPFVKIVVKMVAPISIDPMITAIK